MNSGSAVLETIFVLLLLKKIQKGRLDRIRGVRRRGEGDLLGGRRGEKSRLKKKKRPQIDDSGKRQCTATRGRITAKMKVPG